MAAGTPCPSRARHGVCLAEILSSWRLDVQGPHRTQKTGEPVRPTRWASPREPGLTRPGGAARPVGVGRLSLPWALTRDQGSEPWPGPQSLCCRRLPEQCSRQGRGGS